MVLLICCFFLITPAVASEENIWFPSRDIFNFWIIYEHINELSFTDIDSVRNEYTTILAFIDEIIIAYRENIRRIIYQDITSLKRPALVDGNLTMVETMSDNVFIRDGGQDSYIINNFLILEAVDIIGSIRMRNYLIYFWYNKTGELLSAHIDEIAQVYYLRELILYLSR